MGDGKKFLDSFSGSGMVNIKLFDKNTGELIKEVENHNLIVKVGRAELVKLLVKQSSKGVTKMAIGKGGANIASSPFAPIPPVDGDTGLATLVTTVNVSSATVNTTLANPKVTFVALFDCAVVNSLVNECGLVFDDGTTLFARHTFKTLSLEASTDFSMQITWTIEF